MDGRMEARQGGGCEAGEEGGSEADRTKDKARQDGGREGQTFQPGAALEFQPDFKRNKSGRKYEGHLHGHKMY